MEIAGNLDIDNSVTVEGTSTLIGDTACSGSLAVGTGLAVGTNETIGGTLAVGSNATVTGMLNVSGSAAIVGSLSVTTNETVTGTLSVTSSGAFSNNVTIADKLIVSASNDDGTGAVIQANGIVESRTGGVKFPDGSTQTTAFVSSSVGNAYKSNLVVTTPNNGTIDVTADTLSIGTSWNGSTDIYTSSIITYSFNQTITITSSGANGLDTGSLTTATWYGVFAIATPNGTVSALISKSYGTLANGFQDANPMLPSGYTLFRRLGFVYTATSSTIYLINKINDTTYWADSSTANAQTVLNGTHVTDFTALIPPPSLIGILMWNGNTSISANINITQAPVGYSIAATLVLAQSGTNGNNFYAVNTAELFVGKNRQLNTVNNFTGAAVTVMAYRDIV